MKIPSFLLLVAHLIASSQGICEEKYRAEVGASAELRWSGSSFSCDHCEELNNRATYTCRSKNKLCCDSNCATLTVEVRKNYEFDGAITHDMVCAEQTESGVTTKTCSNINYKFNNQTLDNCVTHVETSSGPGNVDYYGTCDSCTICTPQASADIGFIFMQSNCSNLEADYQDIGSECGPVESSVFSSVLGCDEPKFDSGGTLSFGGNGVMVMVVLLPLLSCLSMLM